MSAPQLIRHGEHTKPHYAPAPGEDQSWAGKSTDEDRPDGNVSGIVRRYSKHSRASETPNTLGLIDKQYADAIRYNKNLSGLRGLSMMSGLFAIGITPFFVLDGWDLLVEGSWIFGTLFVVTPILAGTTIFLWTIRLELFRPIDEPTIFDRKHRKVYRVFCEAQPGWTGLFKPWPLRAVEYDWDLIDAEHNASIVTTGSTVRRDHALVFIVRSSADDPTIIDSFNIGNSLMFVIDDAVDAVWEHIRRFMEEGGPHLPPGESVAVNPPEPGFWRKLLDISPLRSTYWHWWREELPLMLLFHALLPISLPFVVLWQFLGWLCIKTSRSVVWPQEVVDAIGESFEQEEKAE